MIKTAKIEKEFCNEIFTIRCVVFKNRVRISFKCAEDRYTLRVYDTGKFEYDFSHATMWESEVQDFLEECFYEAVKLAS